MRGPLYLLIATLLAALGWVASKLVVEQMPGEVFIASRFLLASLFLLPFCYKSLWRLRAKKIILASGTGSILAIGLLIWVYAVSISNSLSEGAFIMSVAVIIAPMTAWIMFKVKPHKAFWVALPISVIGMMLLSLSHGWEVETSQGYFLLASALMSVHFVLNKKLSSKLKPLDSICLQLFVVGIVAGIYSAVTHQVSFEWNDNLLFWFAISTLIATSVRYLLQTIGQHQAKMETAALIMILEPIWTMILSVSFLDETVSVQKIIGGAMIFISLFLYIKLSKPAVKAAS
ncbi:DMT family transporter [Shewanella aestuarii]|uniref:DMT family transporter n=1 Tax=Shewanella aestuarii TaxID=1028752 RepID=A0A6G9QMA2_9GAMM|nr:DMT family transporter [Shewanella aestuarii]QIR15612.1 DMT family transporter [Shewanella aestuarii]